MKHILHLFKKIMLTDSLNKGAFPVIRFGGVYSGFQEVLGLILSYLPFLGKRKKTSFLFFFSVVSEFLELSFAR